jgi:hypothetical protein
MFQVGECLSLGHLLRTCMAASYFGKNYLTVFPQKWNLCISVLCGIGSCPHNVNMYRLNTENVGFKPDKSRACAFYHSTSHKWNSKCFCINSLCAWVWEVWLLIQLILRHRMIDSWRALSPGQTRKHCCGNICDSWCFLKCFPICPPMETLLRKQNLLPEKQKCFLANSETFDVSMFLTDVS